VLDIVESEENLDRPCRGGNAVGVPKLKWHHRLLIAAGCALLFVAPAHARAKTDVVTVDTGDSITCEIKSLERGLLKVSTDYMSTVYIEWRHVEQLSSTHPFQLEIEDGRRYFGPISAATEARKITISTATDTVTLDHPDVVRITAIEKKFSDRIDGSIDIGVNAKKANSERGYTIGARTNYRSQKFLFKASLDSSYSDRTDAEFSERNDLEFQYQRFRKNRWFVTGYSQFETNNELDLDLRAMVGGGVGRYLIQTNRTLFSLVGGLATNRELYSTVMDDSDKINLEGVFAGSFQLFTFGDRETDLTVTLSLLPGITDWGRIRSNFGANLRKELIKDFYISFNFTATYDSDPPTEGAKKEDWNTWASVGYSF
jgi:hypothetical protein